MVTTPPYTAFLKIAEGCSNGCAFCIIPKLRGRYRSRSMEALVEEARGLAASGVKELIVIAQDITRYGWTGRTAPPWPSCWTGCVSWTSTGSGSTTSTPRR